MRILIVEDDIRLATNIEHILLQNNYIVDISYDGEDGLDNILSDVYDVVILDYMLPKMNGIEILIEARKNNINTSIIMLTAKGELEDKVEGLTSGADDYLVKPFESLELLARLKALGRRSKFEVNKNNLEFGNLTLFPDILKIKTSYQTIEVSVKEKELLELLMNRKNMITSKLLIIEKVWGYDSDAIDNNVEVYVSFLRKKLKAIKANFVIKAVRGAGYILEVHDV